MIWNSMTTTLTQLFLVLSFFQCVQQLCEQLLTSFVFGFVSFDGLVWSLTSGPKDHTYIRILHSGSPGGFQKPWLVESLCPLGPY